MGRRAPGPAKRRIRAGAVWNGSCSCCAPGDRRRIDIVRKKNLL
jgi:hypothetical protein